MAEKTCIYHDDAVFCCFADCRIRDYISDFSRRRTTTMTSGPSNVLFDDLFTIDDIDKEGKKFDRGEFFFAEADCASTDLGAVSRLYARSSNFDMGLTLDYNLELYPLKPEEKFSLVLASSLGRGGTGGGVDGNEDDKDRDVWRPDGKGKRGLEEDYEYVMYGKVRCISIYLIYHLLLLSLRVLYSNDYHCVGVQVRWRHR